MPGKLKIAISDVGEIGRGLVALENVAPGEVLLSVPLESVFSDTEVNEQHGQTHRQSSAVIIMQQSNLNLAKESADIQMQLRWVTWGTGMADRCDKPSVMERQDGYEFAGAQAPMQ